ncbi:H-type lectin domain protein (macronuclear) [Tetrahymena thermophila SB210]|uniref:H-type lectin domain protein n=1 Tax=Tetrahymena thermophila (strain SB210) TaxID=312017 RepID=Q23C50_TETTS|nr:H-type lectin domain protein [Tetrahymena thermophila SB210]EAR93918.2 H-type lectin domain protein [Tetrahymena thermophila SB210]|eukprot:XP_001014163.2 H-type lectin domain protein [Tetrahymena thermophila SB210]
MSQIHSTLCTIFIIQILIKISIQQQLITQSDRILIKQEQQVWQSSSISPNSYSDFSVDLSSAKFINNPKIVYALTVYNSDTSSQQGFKITTNSINQTTLSYRLTSLGCTLEQLGFNILAIDDPNIEVQSKQLQSGVTTTITGTQNILQIAGFIFGFQGSSSSNLVLKYSLTKIDNMNYQISFSNSNVQTIYINFIIVYKSSSTDMFQQLYSYSTLSDTQGQNIGGSNTVTWTSSTQIDQSLVFFGLKDFDISSGSQIFQTSYFGIKLQSGQSPEAKNKSVKLNYFTWNNYYVNMVNGIWMGFSITKCQTNYYLFINATYFSCVQSCNSVDHHYNLNTQNIYNLYSTSIIYCQQCNSNCYGCQDGNPSVCTDCYNNQYLNPSTNTCDSVQPANTFCQLKTVSGQTFYNCQNCDSTCQTCSAAANPNSCTSCNISSQNKYFYNNSCLSSQPNSTYCDSNFICKSCDLSCSQCVAPGDANSCTQCNINSANKYFYNNQCLNSQPVGTFCDSNFICQQCSSSCKTCVNSASNCSSCQAGQYLYKGQCSIQQPQSTYCQQYVCYDCPSNCSSCTGPLQTNCTQCVSNFYFFNNQCFSQQPPNTYCDQSSLQCQQCQTSCQQCDVTLNNCTSCSNQYLYKGVCYPQIPKSNGIYCDQTSLICVDCDLNCFNCSKNIKQCTECQLGYYLYNNQCFQQQPQNTNCSTMQKNSNQNQFHSCLTCQAKNCDFCNYQITQCDSCISGSVYNKQNLSCDCPDGYYVLTNFPSSQQICNKCYFDNCSQCNQNGCTKCQNGYFLNKNGQCVYCENSMYVDSNNQCSQPCKKGCLVCSSLQNCAQYYDKSCDLSCQTCTGPSANECLTCSSVTRQFDQNDNSCKCQLNFSENGNKDCKYNYQLAQQSVELQSALNLAQAGIMVITSVSQVIPGMSYSLGLMQILGNVYLNQNKLFNSTTSIFSSFTIFNINSYLEQKIQISSTQDNYNNQRILQSVGSIYPTQQQSNLIVQDKFFFATNNFIQICIILLVFLIALAFHFYSIKTKEELKYINLVRWNMLLFLIHISSNFFLITLLQCNLYKQRMIDLVFIGIFLVMYAFFFFYTFAKIYKNEQLEPQVAILSHGINQQYIYSKYFFVIFEMRKIVYTIFIVFSEQSLIYSLWILCVFQLVFIFINFKIKVFSGKFSYVFLQINEIFLFVLFSILAVMINLNKQNIIQVLGNVLIPVMMLLSVATVVQVLFFVAFKLRNFYLRQRAEIQNKNDRLSISKIELLRCSISLDQKMMWRHKSTTMKNTLAIRLVKNV